jgi:hypothetical protein
MRRLLIWSAAAEAIVAIVALAMGGPIAMAAGLVGSGGAVGAQVGAVAALRPAMKAPPRSFAQKWLVGTALRGASLVIVAVLLLVANDLLPPAWLAAGYLGTMLVLLFAEARFLG